MASALWCSEFERLPENLIMTSEGVPNLHHQRFLPNESTLCENACWDGHATQ